MSGATFAVVSFVVYLLIVVMFLGLFAVGAEHDGPWEG